VIYQTGKLQPTSEKENISKELLLGVVLLRLTTKRNDAVGKKIIIIK